jgi:DNA topoisomerase-1
MDTITLEQALELFKLPRALGDTPEGEPVVTNIGRFGPYVKYGDKYVSLKEDDPYTVELPRALELIRQKKEADANRIIATFPDVGIQVLNGRYGPYVTDGKKNAKIPKDRDPKSLTLEECQQLIEAAPVRFGRFGRFGKGKAKEKPAAQQPTKAAAKAKPAAATAEPARKTRSRKPSPDPHTARIVRKKARPAAAKKKRA